MSAGRSPLRVAIGGFGAVGAALARRLDAGIAGLRLVAVSARDRARAEERVAAALRHPVPVLALAELPARAEVVVECAPAAVFRELVEPAVEAGRTAVCIGAGALLDHLDLVERARATGARIVVPSGAIPGLDAVRAAALGTIERVTMVTRKPPAGLAGAPGIPDGLDLEGLREPVRIFSGTAGEGARLFPANVNVAAALALAGVGPQRTRLEVWADPGVERNVHRIEVEAQAATLRLAIENRPSAENPRTGRIVALSVEAALRRLVEPLTVGT